jgi:antitoxin HigA-1
MTTTLSPVTPGELLLEEFLLPMGITKYRLAKEIGVPSQRNGEIVAGRRTITADTDLRLCRFFGLSDGYWLRAQVAHDTEVAHERLASDLERITPWSGSAAWVIGRCSIQCIERMVSALDCSEAWTAAPA